MKQVILKRGKEDSLLRFHPWVFSGALLRVDDSIEEGDSVRVVTSDGRFVAVGHYQQGSIAVRILTFNDVDIDAQFWVSRLRSALKLRQEVILPSPTSEHSVTDTYRLVHGEGDHLPGLIVDVYGQTAVMQAHSIGMHRCRRQIAEALLQIMEGRIANIYYKSDTTLPFMDNENGFLCGGDEGNIGLENGLKFHVDWLRGQKTGFFIDQRDNRALLERYARNRRVLNMFCYTGGFSVYAMRGGAQMVHSVDSSAKAIELTRRNVELNFPGDQRHKAFCEDAFRFLDNIGDTSLNGLTLSQNYDLVILDPPAFAKHRGALHNALKGYIRLNNKALEKMPPASLLFTFSCSQVVTKDQFRQAVFTAAAQARRKVRILHQLHQPADHPINIYHPEGEYLKGLVLYVE
jgi:23S rRNA (cytosine1962-C5)-methyltransferase